MICEFPKAYQQLDEPHRYKFMCAGRGSGRSWTVARKLILRAAQNKIRILCTRELQKSIKESVHKLISMQIELLGLSKLFTIQQDKITCSNGSEFLFFGIKHNTEEIKSTEGIDICWIEEAHSVTKASWLLLDPTIRKENSEIWIVMNTRFKSDYLYQLFTEHAPPDSLVLITTWRDNSFFPDVLKKQMEAMKADNYEDYLHIWEGQLKKLADGAIFGKQVLKLEKDERRVSIPVLSNNEVHTFWDVGKNDETAVWFLQIVGNEYRIIDFYQSRLEEVEHYTKVLKELDYLYGTHYMPHDADHERLGMRRNIKQQFMDGGVRPITIVPRIPHKATAIQLTRELFPKLWIHKGDDARGKRVEKGYELICRYRYKYKDDDNVFSMTPHHDDSSNAADSLMCIAQANIRPKQVDKYSDWGVSING